MTLVPYCFPRNAPLSGAGEQSPDNMELPRCKETAARNDNLLI